MRIFKVAVVVLSIAGASFPGISQSPADQTQPTAAEAQQFIARANTELLKLPTAASHNNTTK